MASQSLEGFPDTGPVHMNLTTAELVERSIKRQEGVLATSGALVPNATTVNDTISAEVIERAEHRFLANFGQSDGTKAMKRAAADLIWSASAKVSREERADALDFFKSRCDRVRVMPFLEGVPCSIHGIVLPEGTRSPTDQLLPFRDGAFRVAVELGLPVLPIAVAGTRHAMAKGSFRFNRATAEARVLEPIETAHLTREDVPHLRDQVRDRIAAARDQLRQELGIAGASARA